MELEVAKDGRIFFIELNGEFRVFLPETQEAVLIHKFDVTRRGEVGLIGLALDPQFSQNGWVYLQYSPIGLTSQRTSRFTLQGNELIKGSEKVLLQFHEMFGVYPPTMPVPSNLVLMVASLSPLETTPAREETPKAMPPLMIARETS